MGKRKILIAAHSATQVEILTRALAPMDLVVDVHSTVEAAEAAVTNQLSQYELVIADTGSSNCNGFALLMKVRSIDAQFPVLLLTAVDSPDWIVKSQDAKATGYLVKPLAIEKVQTVLSRILPGLQMPLAG